MRIASWNVNSIRVRQTHVCDWLQRQAVDVLGLQELKMQTADFPLEVYRELEYHAEVNGQKTYNGVALLSRQPASAVSCDLPDFVDEQRRVIAGTVNGVRVINVYVVNGQDLGTEKYAYKLRWLEALTAYVAQELRQHPRLVLMGDFNIAPTAADTHDPAQWEGGILCSPAERAALQGLLDLGLRDCFDLFPAPEERFTWWDYRQAGFRRNLGLRIDHILASQPMADICESFQIDREPRKLERPSDHAPVIATFKL